MAVVAGGAPSQSQEPKLHPSLPQGEQNPECLKYSAACLPKCISQELAEKTEQPVPKLNIQCRMSWAALQPTETHFTLGLKKFAYSVRKAEHRSKKRHTPRVPTLWCCHQKPERALSWWWPHATSQSWSQQQSPDLSSSGMNPTDWAILCCYPGYTLAGI